MVTRAMLAARQVLTHQLSLQVYLATLREISVALAFSQSPDRIPLLAILATYASDLCPALSGHSAIANSQVLFGTL
jgi:hypothetical protein